MDDLIRTRIRRVTIILTCLGIIFATALLLMPVMGNGVARIPDKLAHALLFSGVALPTLILPARRWAWVIAGLAVYGGTIELVQPYFGREASLLDWLANLAGLAMAIAIAPILRRGLVWVTTPRRHQTE
ncbi:MAG: VanZ family protein [Roseinatronobacter sp.]